MLHPHRALHARARSPGRSTRGRLLAALPARRPVAHAAVLGTHIRVRQNRPHPVLLVPVRGQTPAGTGQGMGGQLLHMYRRKNQKAIVVDDLAEVGDTGSLGPADEVVARLLVPTRRTEHQAAEATVTRRGDPVAHTGPGCARLALGMPSRHHRTGQALVLARADRLYGDLSKVLQGTGQCSVGIVPLKGVGVEGMRSGRRKDEVERRSKIRQTRACRGKAQLSLRVAPLLALAQSPR